jgi:epoxyqueuosine reductase
MKLTEKNSDREAGFVIDSESFVPFVQKNDVFRRSWWDDRIRNKKTKLFYETYREPLKSWRKSEGFTQKDYALRNAAWHVSDIFTELQENEDRREGFSDAMSLQRKKASTKIDMGTKQEPAKDIKHVGKALGAALVGITAYD